MCQPDAGVTAWFARQGPTPPHLPGTAGWSTEKGDGSSKGLESKMSGRIFGFWLEKLENWRDFLHDLPSFKAKYQVNDRGYRPLSMGYCTFYRFPTKGEYLSDHMGSFPDEGHGLCSHLGSPLSRRRADSPTFWLSLVLIKSTNPPIQTKNVGAIFSR